jgi:hypothetical protein
MTNYMHKRLHGLMNGIKHHGINNTILEKQLQFGDYVLWFLKGSHTHLGANPFPWFGPHKM